LLAIASTEECRLYTSFQLRYNCNLVIERASAPNIRLGARAAVSQPQMLGGFNPHTGKPPALADGS